MLTKRCPKCNGKGSVIYASKLLCDLCNGSGKIDANKNFVKCDACDGEGSVLASVGQSFMQVSCKKCNGVGFYEVKDKNF